MEFYIYDFIFRKISMRGTSALRELRSAPGSYWIGTLQSPDAHARLLQKAPCEIFASSLQFAESTVRTGPRSRISRREGCTGSEASRTVQKNTESLGHQSKSAETREKVSRILLGIADIRGRVFPRPNRTPSSRTRVLDHESRFACTHSDKHHGSLHRRWHALREL